MGIGWCMGEKLMWVLLCKMHCLGLLLVRARLKEPVLALRIKYKNKVSKESVKLGIVGRSFCFSVKGEGSYLLLC